MSKFVASTTVFVASSIQNIVRSNPVSGIYGNATSSRLRDAHGDIIVLGRS